MRSTLKYAHPLEDQRSYEMTSFEYMQQFEQDNKHLWPEPNNYACAHGASLPCLGCRYNTCADPVYRSIVTMGNPDMFCGMCSSWSVAGRWGEKTRAFFWDQAANYEDIVDVIKTLPQPIWEEVLPELNVWRTNPKWRELKNLTSRDCDTITRSSHPNFFPPSDPSYAEVEACPTFVASVATVTTFSPTVGAETGAPTATGTTRQTLTQPKCTKPYSSH